jgi:N-acetylmuramoyl-L-alanine amidase
VIHFTAGRSPQESVSWLTNAAARASAHLVIGRDGSVTQLLPFDRVAWHAGASEWEGLSGLNRHSIGIELDNAGRLTRQGMAWRAWFGTPYVDEEVMEAVHKHELSPSAWHMFTPEQLQAAFEVSLCIVQKYDLRDVVGHDDISPGRKCDPGPAFPLASFRSRLLGRADDDAPPFETTGVLNIRVAPGTQHAKLDVSPLPAATPLEVVRKEEGWWLVNVKVEIGGETDVQGWVHGSFVRRVE